MLKKEKFQVSTNNSGGNMADITMCSDDECPRAKKCYRHEAKRDEDWQSFFVESPRKENNSCRFFWKLRKEN